MSVDTVASRLEALFMDAVAEVCPAALNAFDQDCLDGTRRTVIRPTVPSKRRGSGADFESHAAPLAFWALPSVGDSPKTSDPESRAVAVSALGVVRELTRCELAEALTMALMAKRRLKQMSNFEQAESVMDSEELIAGVRLAGGCAGVLLLTLRERMRAEAAAGRHQCDLCGRFVQGTTGLWWHRKTAHGEVHSQAVKAASIAERALVQWKAPKAAIAVPVADSSTLSSGTCQFAMPHELALARDGCLDALRSAARAGWNAEQCRDRHGACALQWAAGSGHKEVCAFLVEELSLFPGDPQRGRRGYRGRTPLMWAARNGHIGVVCWLVDCCAVQVDGTTADGTTALCWAVWQGQLEVVRFLLVRGADVRTVNEYGCNPALWAAQGSTPRALEVCRELKAWGADFFALNKNDHGCVHKAAQRGHFDVCAWLLDEGGGGLGAEHLAPDAEGSTPATLARFEGYSDLADWLQARTDEMVNQTKGLRFTSKPTTIG